MEIFSVIGAFILQHEVLFLAIAFTLSEFLGQTKLVKENGILALVFGRILDFLRQRGAIDLTPNEDKKD